MKKSIHTRQQEALQKILRDLRVKTGLSQVRLAKILTKPQSFVSKYESGERRLDLIEIWHICKVLEIKLSDLVIKLEEQIQ